MRSLFLICCLSFFLPVSAADWFWQNPLPLGNDLRNIHVFSATNAMAVGENSLLKTNDGGQTWQKRFLDSLLFEEDREYLNDLKDSDPEGYEIETASILPHFNRIVKK